jgi:plastocyanin
VSAGRVEARRAIGGWRIGRGLACALAVACALAHPAPSGAATVAGTIVVDGRATVDTVVYLEGARETPPPATPPTVVMDQRNLAFVPGVLPVVRGTVVQFTNSDDVQHNVFSPSAAAGKFDLGTMGRGEEGKVTLARPGEVLVLCNIHMEMEGRILVLRDPFFATTRADGGYAIEGVPAGTYSVRVWRKRWLPLERSLEVPPHGALTLDLRE